MKNNLLSIQDLTVSFDAARRVVDGLSLDMKEDSFTALVGESGSGKSVTALCVTKLITPRTLDGRVWFSGPEGSVDLLALPEARLRRIRGKDIAYVFQDIGSSLDPVMKVGRQLEEALQAHGSFSAAEARNKALESLESVRLREAVRVYKSYPHELSGGMKQRVMMAMALVTNPRLLIADEATTALDPKTQDEILELLVSVKRERGLAVLFITHDLVLAKRCADNIVVMKKGKALPEKDPYVQRLFHASLFDSKPKQILEVD